MARGIFITFEGLDGSGKTTQLKRLQTWLESSGLRVTTLRNPGGTALGERIRGILLDSRTENELGGIAPNAELALMFADRAQSLAEIVRPALERGEIVLCDRYTDSSEAYQGGGRQLGSQAVLATHNAICDGFYPDLTILLLPELTTSLQRARHRNVAEATATGTDENRFEREDDAFYARIHAAYERIAERDAGRVVAIRHNGTVDEVEVLVREVVTQRLDQLLNGATW
jgi:dTMP kinase